MGFGQGGSSGGGGGSGITAIEASALDASFKDAGRVYRGNTTRGAEPTPVEFVTPTEGDSCIAVLSDGRQEHWRYQSGSWLLAVDLPPAGGLNLERVTTEANATTDFYHTQDDGTLTVIDDEGEKHVYTA